MSPREYTLYLTRSQKWALYLPAAMFVLMPVIFIIVFSTVPELAQAGDEKFPFPPAWFLAVFVLVGLFMLWQLATVPTRISVTSDNRIKFASRFRSVEILAADVESIEPSSPRWPQMPLPITTYALKHRNGQLRFPGQFTDQHRFFSELRETNPNVRLLGC